MEKSQKQAVTGIIFDHGSNEVLLIKRRDIPVWVLPAGGIEPSETPEAAVCRELLEETGCQVEIVRKIAEYLPVNRLTQLTHFYECRIVSGKPNVGEETKAIAFFPIERLPKLPPPYLGWIKDALLQKELIQKKIEGVSYFILIKLLIQHPVLVGRYLLTKMGLHINR